MKLSNQSKGALRLAVNTLAICLASTCMIVGSARAAEDGAWGGGRHGMSMQGDMDPARAAKMIDHMIARRVPDATADQKARLSAIAKAAMADMQPLHKQQKAARAETLRLLTQPTIDRAALEKARANQVAIADSISARRMKALADAAEVLTPAQRAKIAERMDKRMRKHQQPGS